MAISQESLKINKERTWVFSPVNNVVFKVEIEGELTTKQLEEAIRKACSKQELFHYHVSVDESGNANFVKGSERDISIKEEDCTLEALIRREEKMPFNIWEGEFLRAFIISTPQGMALILIAHHIAGDGLSYTYLIQDIMRTLNEEETPYRPLQLFAMTDLPIESKLSLPMKLLLNSMNRKWNKTGKIFGRQDFEQMYAKYWKDHASKILTYTIKHEDFKQMIKVSKAHEVTVNTLLMTCFLKAAKEKCSVGYAVNIREKGYEGMGNFATGLSIDYQYDEKKDLWENAKQIQLLVKEKMESPKKKFFLLQFLGALSGTLQDAVYFSACDAYENKTATTFCKMFGYEGNPKGISITNLTKAPIMKQYGKWQISGLTFVPPLVLNSQRIIGVVSLEDEMVITCHLEQNDKFEVHRAFFEEGINILSRL